MKVAATRSGARAETISRRSITRALCCRGSYCSPFWHSDTGVLRRPPMSRVTTRLTLCDEGGMCGSPRTVADYLIPFFVP